MVDNFAHIGFNRCFRHTVCSKYSANIFSKTQHFDFISFVRKDRQTDKYPKPCGENKPFGKPSVASLQ